MNLKQIQDDDSLIVVQEVNEKIRFQFYWLAEELEKATETIDRERLIYADCIRKIKEEVATRCAEIADSAKYNTSESPSDYENACLDIFDAISKEFNLPKAG